MTAAAAERPADHEAIGGRRHVRRSLHDGETVVRKSRRSLTGGRPRSLYIEAGLQSEAAARFADWPDTPVEPPIHCTATVLTTRYHRELSGLDRAFSDGDRLDTAAARVAAALGRLHRTERRHVEELPPAVIESPPLDPFPLSGIGDQSAATLEFAAVLQKSGLAAALGGLGKPGKRGESGELGEPGEPPAPQQPDVFAHGDLKFDNVLTDDTGSTIRIIDWECAGRAPAVIDLAAFAASLICEGIKLGAVAAEESVAEGLRRTDEETTKAWSAISVFLARYREETTGAHELPIEELRHWFARSLLARATSYTDAMGSFDRLPKSLVQVARNVVFRPEAFDRRFR